MKKGDTTKTIEKLRKAAGRKAPPAETPTELPADAITINEEVFQRRGPYLTGPRSQLIDEIARDLKKAGCAQGLDPVTVWWAGKWLLVDGHHRMAAVRKSLGADAAVPVVALEGDLAAALAATVGLNRKTKAAMSTTERLNGAWFLALHAPEMSQAQVEAATGASGGTINEQRRVLRELRRLFAEDGFDAARQDPERLTWREARAALAGRELPTWDAEEGRKAATGKAVRMIASSGLAKMLHRNPEAVAAALQEVCPGFMADEEEEAGEEEEATEAASPMNKAQEKAKKDADEARRLQTIRDGIWQEARRWAQDPGAADALMRVAIGPDLGGPLRPTPGDAERSRRYTSDSHRVGFWWA